MIGYLKCIILIQQSPKRKTLAGELNNKQKKRHSLVPTNGPNRSHLKTR
ncbi:hypothetical protein IAD21_03714 [Abditibacteriota bacterium]|nr:hypothetical protein IAD21_03714 [Abditibacteriota bacterium]